MFTADICNPVIDAIETADAIIIGSPVYFAANGALDALLDRIFYAGNCFKYKLGAACVVARRVGTSSALDQLIKYFTIKEMPVVSSVYWPMEYGQREGKTREDKEGIYILERLGKNIAWLLKSIECAKENGIEPPESDIDRPITNFIRN